MKLAAHKGRFWGEWRVQIRLGPSEEQFHFSDWRTDELQACADLRWQIEVSQEDPDLKAKVLEIIDTHVSGLDT